MSYKLLKKVVIVFLAAYFSVGLLARFLSIGTERFYPFFSWFLFTRVPPRIQTSFDLRIYEFEGKQFDPPIFFEKAGSVYKKNSRLMAEYRNLIQRLGTAAKQNRKDEITQLRRELEANFLSHPVIYDIVEIRYNIIEYWKSGHIIEAKQIAIFNSQATTNE